MNDSEKFQLFCQADSQKKVVEHWQPFQDLKDLATLRRMVCPAHHPPTKQFFQQLEKIQREFNPKSDEHSSLHCKRIGVVGAGPVGLFQAIVLRLMGADVVVLERRREFSRNNVVHIWPSTLDLLKHLGVKYFHKKLGAGGLHHVAIKTLQLCLLKVALVVGCRFFTGVAVKGPDFHHETQSWCLSSNSDDCISLLWPVEVVIAADGEHSAIAQRCGLRHHAFQAGPAIGITGNFVLDPLSAEEREALETNVSAHFARESFARLRATSGLEMENLVYFRDDTHYLVFSPKKASLLSTGVLREDKPTVEELLAPGNVDREQLLLAVRRVAEHVGLPELRFAERGAQPDVAIFDFTRKKFALSAHSYLLHPDRMMTEETQPMAYRSDMDLLALAVGDALIAPFWPQGTGIPRGFLGALDNCYFLEMIFSPSCQVCTEDRSSTVLQRTNQSKAFLKSTSVLKELRAVMPENLIHKRIDSFAEYLKPNQRYQRLSGTKSNLVDISMTSPERQAFERELSLCLLKQKEKL